MPSLNPLLQDWTSKFGLPPFDMITDDHFDEAIKIGIKQARTEINIIANNSQPANFKNTIDAWELSGKTLSKVLGVFWNLNSANSSEKRKKLERKYAPILTHFFTETSTNPKLFDRVKILYNNRDTLNLTAEQIRVLELYYQNGQRAGAELSKEKLARLMKIMTRLSELGTSFTQNLLKEESEWFHHLSLKDLEGCPDFLISALKSAAQERNKTGYGITLSRSLVFPFLDFSTRRDLREIIFTAWTKRGENSGDTDNRAIISETLILRQERAKLLGYKNFAYFKLEPEMAGNPKAVKDLLMAVWEPAKKAANADAEVLKNMMHNDGLNDELKPWDWGFYTQKRRMVEHDLNEVELKPYFQLDNMIAAAFDCATRLFDLKFTPITPPLYHPDARAWEVTKKGRHMAIFIGDYFARSSKRSGAWCSRFRAQSTLNEEIRPLVVNICNFAKAPSGEKDLLSFDDARTLFHEFGHALHTILSDVTYEMISGTSVARDFVELPSQLYEHWLSVPEVLKKYAIHAKTGEAIPSNLLARLLAAENFNQGFLTVEYSASALVDLAFHTNPAPKDPLKMQANILADIGMPQAIKMRHAAPHFAHIFSGDGYSSAYYSYMWSEVMDADAFAAFTEIGDPFNPQLAQKLHDYIYSAGGSEPADILYKKFRGSMPDISALLRGRGLTEV